MNIKHIFPITINYYLRHFFEFINQTTPEYEEVALDSSKKVFFLDAPAYGNIGDQAIAFAMEKFVSDYLPNYRQIEITEDHIPSSIKWLKKNISENDIICLTGGGNMGVLYQRYEAVRRLIITCFPNNPIIVFPQTFDYGDDNYSQKELIRARKIYGRAKKIVLCARDEDSYIKMKEAFKNAKIIFSPDIVLYLDYRTVFKKDEKVGICLRQDKESFLTDDQRKSIIEMYENSTLLSTINDNNEYINWKNRRQIVENKLQEFGTKKMIITDRLHGAIFAFITNTPCIAYPNTNGKIERVCNYLTNCGNIVFRKEIENKAPSKMAMNEMNIKLFDELINEIRKLA